MEAQSNVPQIKIERENRSGWMLRHPDKKTLGTIYEGFETANQKKEYTQTIKKEEVYALAEIGVQFGEELSLSEQLAIFYLNATEDFAKMGEISPVGIETEIVEFKNAFEKANDTFQFDPVTGSAKLCNVIGNPDGIGDLIHETLLSGFQEGSHVLILKRQRGQETVSELHITIPLGDKDKDIPTEEADVTMGTGEFKNISFSDSADQMVSSFNQSALKFQAEVVDLQLVGKRLVEKIKTRQ